MSAHCPNPPVALYSETVKEVMGFEVVVGIMAAEGDTLEMMALEAPEATTALEEKRNVKEDGALTCPRTVTMKRMAP